MNISKSNRFIIWNGGIIINIDNFFLDFLNFIVHTI